MKNCFDRTPHTMKDWLLLAAGAAAVFAAADWLPDVLRRAGAFLGLLAPFGWGLLLAYVLDIPTRFFAQKLFGGRRGGAMAVSYALFFGALALLAALVVPQLVQSVTTFAGRLGAYEETIRGLLVWVQNTFGIDTATAEQLVQMVGTALQNWFGGLSRGAARAAADFVSGAAGAAGNAVVALAARDVYKRQLQRRADVRAGQLVGPSALAVQNIAVALHQNVARAQHVRQLTDLLGVGDGLVERIGEVVRAQDGQVRVVGLQVLSLIHI